MCFETNSRGNGRFDKGVRHLSTMQLQHLPNFIRQIKNFFPDSKLNDPTSEAILERFKANNEQTTDVAIEDFLRLLSSIERPEGIPFDESKP